MATQFYNPADYLEYFSNPLWYMDLHPTIQELYVDYNKLNEKIEEEKEKKNLLKPRRLEFTLMVGVMLEKGQIAIASEGIEDFDEEREPIDTVIIHHTGKGSSSTSKDRVYNYLNAVDMLQVYVPQFRNPDREYYNTPLWSGHFYGGKMTFVPYHYIIFKDGRVENILKDEYIGWQAGRWEINKRSIAIAFVADLEEDEPTEEALKSAKEIIGDYRLKVSNKDSQNGNSELQVLGHREVNDKTFCPGNLFLGENGWKKKLLPR